jgi:ferredoxin
MKIVVDFHACMGNAQCMLVAPELFEVREDGSLYVLEEAPSEDLRAKATEAALLCPTQAITIED